MRTLRLALHRLLKPSLAATTLLGTVLLLARQFPQLTSIQEPGALLSTGFVGVWAVQWGPPTRNSVLIVAGILGALLVAMVDLALGGFLGLPGPASPGMDLARAALAGLLGVGVATLLQQRFTT
jgi:hypothetical protein